MLFRYLYRPGLSRTDEVASHGASVGIAPTEHQRARVLLLAPQSIVGAMYMVILKSQIIGPISSQAHTSWLQSLSGLLVSFDRT